MAKRKKKTHPNTAGREVALQYLYMVDLTREAPDLEDFISGLERAMLPESVVFSGRIIDYVVKEVVSIDEQIQRAAENWRVERIAVVERNILRIAVAEMRLTGDVIIAINEALELTKHFSDPSKSKDFVNGVLDRVGEEIRDAKDAKKAKGPNGDRPGGGVSPSGGRGGPCGPAVRQGGPERDQETQAVDSSASRIC